MNGHQVMADREREAIILACIHVSVEELNLVPLLWDGWLARPDIKGNTCRLCCHGERNSAWMSPNWKAWMERRKEREKNESDHHH